MIARRTLAWAGVLAAYVLTDLLARLIRRPPAAGTRPEPDRREGEAVAHRPSPRAAGTGRDDRLPSGHGAPGDRAPDDSAPGDRAPGDEQEAVNVLEGLRGYGIGLGLALVLTGISFYVAGGASLVWTPGIPIALVVFAIAQMGVHLVFFLHVTTGPDNANNALALAFGTLVVFLVLSGSLWIMSNLNHNMISMEHIRNMQR